MKGQLGSLAMQGGVNTPVAWRPVDYHVVVLTLGQFTGSEASPLINPYISSQHPLATPLTVYVVSRFSLVLSIFYSCHPRSPRGNRYLTPILETGSFFEFPRVILHPNYRE